MWFVKLVLLKIRWIMKKYNGCWMDLFKISFNPNSKYPVILETPDIDYGMTKDQFREFRKKVNEVEV